MTRKQIPPDVPEQYKKLVDDIVLTINFYADRLWGIVSELGCDKFECDGNVVMVTIRKRTEAE